ncbi:Uncharacterised protein [Raoultella terrigena]|uniref:Uncharacterized protein n=1 Tax=Raoultella terrigena TaxID=577 RepID=A0A4U9DBJ8_RAOTE|nr:Uncharacterised protein [Raoultella terrigena]
MYDMKNWNMPGWAFGASYVYAWDAKPGKMATPDAYYNADKRLEESAYSLDAMYTVQTAGQKERCSNSTSLSTTTTPTFQAGAAVTATSSRMSVT